MAQKFKQGYFKPKHPEKYIGNIDKIRYMSSWEAQTFNFLDNNPNILEWASEEIKIPYVKPTDNKIHTYLPDLFVCYRNKSGEIIRELIEIKPAKQTKAPRKNTKQSLYESAMYAVNVCKWDAAVKWCEHMSNKKGYKITFKLLTEKQIFS